MTTLLRIAFAVLLPALLLAGCATPPPPVGLSDVIERPAERALLAGMRAYDDAQYPEAEHQLKAALDTGLASAKDRANANKLLAFIYCSSQRVPACDAAFRAARAADPGFQLSRAEAGHPMWGPVYRQLPAVAPAPK
jgi:Tfp pilus assembly protein PilF